MEHLTFIIPRSWSDCPVWWQNIVTETWKNYPNTNVAKSKLYGYYNEIFNQYDAKAYRLENESTIVIFYDENLYISFLLRWSYYMLPYYKVYENPWSLPNRNYHVIHIKDTSEILKRDVMTKEFHEWMKANIKGGRYRHGKTFYAETGDVEDFLFTREDSALLFKMRFG